MAVLQNPPESPCFGCGPHHPRGLRLAFERHADEIRTTYTPREDEVGWPGLLHTGLHYMVLFEASYWAALELAGKVHVATGPQVFDQTRLPRVGVPFTVTSRLLPGDKMCTVATSATPEGKQLARLTVGWRPFTRGQAERSGLKLPGYLLQEMAE